MITPIPPSGVGEIAYVQGGTRYTAPARTRIGVAPWPAARPSKSPGLPNPNFTSRLFKIGLVQTNETYDYESAILARAIRTFPASASKVWRAVGNRRGHFRLRRHLGQPLHQGRPKPGAGRFRPQTQIRRAGWHACAIRGFRIVKGGGTFVIPVLEKVDRPLAGIAHHRCADARGLHQQRRAGQSGRRGPDQNQGRRHFHRHRRRAGLEQDH